MTQQTMFAKRIENLKSSPIRDILSVIDRPGMISFAGGLPSTELLPALDTSKIDRTTLQYGPSEGESALRQAICDEVNLRGIDCSAEQVIVLSGSQQGIDLTAKLFTDEQTTVAVESPTYLAALQVFRFFGANFQTFDPNEIDTAKRYETSHKTKVAGEVPSLLYINPTFQNPTGYCYSLNERANTAAYCDEYGVTLFEDDPYRDLVYDDCERRPVVSLIQQSNWIYQSSFSKSFAPGLRLGYLICSENLTPYLIQLKQAADLHSNRLSQALALAFLRNEQRLHEMKRKQVRYQEKRDIFDRALRRHFSGKATWHTPPGGLFFWLTLDGGEKLDTRRLLPQAIKENVAFMPGEEFYVDNSSPRGRLRLNFSHATAEEVDQGLSRLANLITTLI